MPTEQVTCRGPFVRRKDLGFDLFAHAFGEEHRPLRVGLFAHHHELFAAEARHRVGGSLHAPQDVAEATNHDISHVVSVNIVDLLEKVDVGDQHREVP